MTEHTINISHDPLLKLAAAHCSCGEWSTIQGHARDTEMARSVAIRIVGVYGDLHVKATSAGRG